MGKYLTERGEELLLEVLVHYCELGKHYDPYVGNFGFTKEDVKKYMSMILDWLSKHEEYKLIYQDGYDDGKCYWLTDF